jgi:hypothetical protein
MASAYLTLFILLAVASEITCSYFYKPQPFLSLFQSSTLMAGFIGFFSTQGMKAFLYNKSLVDDRAGRMLAWVIGISAIVITLACWVKYLLISPNAQFNEGWFKGVTLISITAVVYITMGLITWRLLGNKTQED